MAIEFTKSPKALVALQVTQVLDRFLGAAAAQSWMLSPHPMMRLPGQAFDQSPVGCIKSGEFELVDRALRALAAEHGAFATAGDDIAATPKLVRDTKKASPPKKNSRGASPQKKTPTEPRAAAKPVEKLDPAKDMIWV
jgi:hypothetical protein